MNIHFLFLKRENEVVATFAISQASFEHRHDLVLQQVHNNVEPFPYLLVLPFQTHTKDQDCIEPTA